MEPDHEQPESTKRIRQELYVGMLYVRKNKILQNEVHMNNYIYRKMPEGTKKYYFDIDDWVTSLPNKPPNYFIRVDNICV